MLFWDGQCKDFKGAGLEHASGTIFRYNNENYVILNGRKHKLFTQDKASAPQELIDAAITEVSSSEFNGLSNGADMSFPLVPAAVNDQIIKLDSVLIDTDPHPIWYLLHPNTAPPKQILIPKRLAGKSVYVYDLPTPYHVDLVNAMEMSNNINGVKVSNCDYGRSVCFEVNRTSVGLDYSQDRNYAAEIPILSNLLLLPRTDDKDKAYLFVVPFLMSTFQHVNCPFEWQLCGAVAGKLNELIYNYLPLRWAQAFSGTDNFKRRHFFVNSREVLTIFQGTHIKEISKIVLDVGVILTTAGPLPTTDTPLILVPPLGALFGSDLRPKSHPHVFILFVAGMINSKRQDVYSQLEVDKTKYLNITIFLRKIEDHRSIPISTEETVDLMTSSIFCPVVEGDTTFQHRFFDVLVAGCIPVVFTYTVSNPFKSGKECYAADKADPRNCLEYVYPFSSKINWNDIVVHLPAEPFRTKGLTEALLAFNQSEVNFRRNQVMRLRDAFLYYRYDYTNTTGFDAFSLILDEACDIIERRTLE